MTFSKDCKLSRLSISFHTVLSLKLFGYFHFSQYTGV
jgi:hypothetical protein